MDYNKNFRLIFRPILLLVSFISFNINAYAQTGIGTTTPNASAKLDVYATNKGFLPPRVALTSATDATTIASPAEGLLVYNLGSVGLQAGYYYWNGANWATIATATSAGNGVTASDMVKIYDGVGNAATINSTGATFSVTTSGKYSFDFSTSATCGNCIVTLNFQVRDGSNNNAVIASDMQTSYSNNVHAEYNGKVEANLTAGRSYNVLVTTSAGNIYSNDYTRVYMKQVSGNLPVTGQTVEYGIARYTGADGSTIADNAIVPFDAMASGNLTWTSNKFTLKANRTYELESSLAIFISGSAAGVAGRFQIYDYTNNVALANGLFMSQNGAGSNGQSANSPMKGIITPATDIQVGIRLLDHYGPNGPSIVGNAVTTGVQSAPNASYFMVKQVGSSAIVNPWTLSGTNTFNTTGNVGIGNNAPTQALDVTGAGRFSNSIINSGARSYFGKDVANMHWFATTDGVGEPNNLAFGFESNGTSIQSHKWYTGGTQKMHLSSLGKLGIGTASPETSLHIENGNVFGANPASTSSPSLYIYNNNNASTSAHATALVRAGGLNGGKPYIGMDVINQFGYSMGVNNPTDQFILNTTWNFLTGTASNNAITINRSGQSRVVIPSDGGAIAGSWPSGWGGGLATYDFSCAGIYYGVMTARSDRRLKNTIVDLDNKVISKYLQLRPVNFYWNDGSDNHHRQYGLIAQEVEELFPDIVSIANDSMQTKSVNYQALHALSLKVIQAQQAEIELLKKKQFDFETRLLKLETKLNQP